MGTKHSINKMNANEDEQMRIIILKLVKDQFDEFRKAVLADYRLIDKFRYATNN